MMPLNILLNCIEFINWLLLICGARRVECEPFNNTAFLLDGKDSFSLVVTNLANPVMQDNHSMQMAGRLSDIYISGENQICRGFNHMGRIFWDYWVWNYASQRRSLCRQKHQGRRRRKGVYRDHERNQVLNKFWIGKFVQYNFWRWLEQYFLFRRKSIVRCLLQKWGIFLKRWEENHASYLTFAGVSVVPKLLPKHFSAWCQIKERMAGS